MGKWQLGYIDDFYPISIIERWDSNLSSNLKGEFHLFQTMHVVPVCVTPPQPSFNFQTSTFQQQQQQQQQQHNFDANFLFVPEPSDVTWLRSSPYHIVPSPADSFVSSTSSFDARSPTMFSPSGDYSTIHFTFKHSGSI